MDHLENFNKWFFDQLHMIAGQFKIRSFLQAHIFTSSYFSIKRAQLLDVVVVLKQQTSSVLWKLPRIKVFILGF